MEVQLSKSSEKKHNTRPDPEAISHIKALIGDEDYVRALDPVGSEFPRAAYNSEDWLRLEHEYLFARSWVFAATDGELDRIGAIKPIDIAGQPIIILRDNQGDVRAFHNVCRHRGSLLITKPCRKASITCPYHAWSYNLDGRLALRPHFLKADDATPVSDHEASQLGLRPVRIERWNGCYFVCLAENTQSLNEWLAPLDARTYSYDLSDARWIGKLQFVVNCNWKIAVENYMDGYHVFNAHPKLLEHAPMNIRWSGDWDGHIHYNDYVAAELSPGRGNELPHFSNLSDEDRRRGFWFISLPNLALEVFADQMVFLVAHPITPTKTREELHFFVAGNAAATDEKYENNRRELLQLWEDLNNEDIGLLERLQHGRSSPAYTGAVNSPQWDCALQQLPRKMIELMTTCK